jgi:cysteine-rich repeat protein
MTVCGNGVIEPPEECDDGNSGSGDGCSGCIIDYGSGGDGKCGNVCDQGDPPYGNCVGCTLHCDVGYTPSVNGCDRDTSCGNGVIEPHEECDDGNTIDDDGCSGCIVDSLPSGGTIPCFGQKDRTKPFNELNASPATRVKLTKLCVKEVGGQGEDAQVAFFETLFNRSSAEGKSINGAMHNGYYEPINKGTVDSVSTSSSSYASCERALNRALAGSNTIGCRRHAATNCDWARRFGGVTDSCVTIGGEAFYSKPGDSCDDNFC